MTITLVEANKLKNKKTNKKQVERIYAGYTGLLEKPLIRRKAKPRKSNYKKIRSWWENK